MCVNPKGGKWRTSTAPWSQTHLSRMPPCTLCRWYVYLNSFVWYQTCSWTEKKSTPWGHVCYLYILNAPGSSAKQTMSPNSRAASAKSSRSSSSFCCCHGSMHSQVLRAAPPPHQNSLWSWGCCLCYNVITNKPFFSYCSAPAAFLCTATGSPHHISHPLREGCLTDWQSPRLVL